MAARSTALLPGADPFDMAGGEVGVLLLHGFTGTPQSMRPWGESLAAAGLTVSCPLLPGHGTSWRDMARTTWRDWHSAADDAFTTLRKLCPTVFVMGLSMGGTLTLRLAEEHGRDIAGAVTVNASLATERRDAPLAPLLSKLVASVAGVASDIKAPGVREVAYDRVPLKAFASLRELWSVTRADLHRVTCPLIAYRSVTDHVVEASSGRILLAGVTSVPVSERLLENSFHVATLDNDKETIFSGSLELVRAHSPQGAVGDG
jgi:carboxylesterase